MTTPDRRALSERTSAHAHTYSGVSTLPLELMASILGYLTPGELWTAASVSRGFRAAARHAGLYLRYRIFWRLNALASCQLGSLLELAAHTRRHGWLVSFDWTCYLSRSAQSDTELRVLQETEDQVSAVIASIAALMPYIVHLNIELPSSYGRDLDQLLLVPAPHLLTFELRRHGQGRGACAIPALLFAGSAPVLYSVGLHSLVLPDEAIPAFARVRRLRIAYEELFPLTKLSRDFPSLRSLHLNYALPNAGLSPDCAGRALSGLRLDELTVGESWQREMRMIDNVLPLRDIPLVRQHGFVYDLGESLWQTQTEPLSVRARATAPEVTEGEGPIEVLVVPHGSAWRRVFLLETWDDIERGLMCAWPPFPTHMAYLRLDRQFFADFLRGGTYAALRRIRIDMRVAAKSVLPPRSPHAHGDQRVDCPTLDEVVIYAMDKPRKMEPRDVARLGSALGQLDRAADARARLVLVGVSFAVAFARPPLNSAFLRVDTRPFDIPGTAADDAGMWDF